MPSLKKSERQPNFIYEMMQRLGIEPGEVMLPRLGLVLHDGVSPLPELPGQRGLPQMARQHAMLGGQCSELLSERGYSIRIGR